MKTVYSKFYYIAALKIINLVIIIKLNQRKYYSPNLDILNTFQFMYIKRETVFFNISLDLSYVYNIVKWYNAPK